MTILTIPQVLRASLTKFSGRPESTLRIHTAYSIVTSSDMMFGYVSDPCNPSMRLIMCKMGDTSVRSQKTLLNTDFSFWTDCSPIRFDTSERNKDGRFFAIDLKLLPEYKREAQEPLNESPSMRGRV
jgi:hypothetical protein